MTIELSGIASRNCLKSDVAQMEPCLAVSSPYCLVPGMERSAGFSKMIVVFLEEFRAATMI